MKTHAKNCMSISCGNCNGSGSVRFMYYSRVCPVCHGASVVIVPKSTGLASFPSATVLPIHEALAKRATKKKE